MRMKFCPMIKKLQQRQGASRTVLACARWSVIGLATLAAVGCSVLEEDKIDYRSARKVSNLEVPPDLTQLSRDPRYVAPVASVTASSLQVQQARAAEPAAPVQSELRIERAGSQRWLVVDRAPEKLWEPLKSFWQDSGFNLALEQQNLGIMETEWAENRAKLPQDVIRSTIGKVFDSLYSTGERDKFRTRIERNAQGGSEIYISHRGMTEVYTSDKKEQTVWQPRASDVELEAEFLRRLMLKLGTTPEQAKAVLAAGTQPSAGKFATVNGQPALQVAEGFDRAWRRVGLALDRSGFTVEDRDRSQGVYFVRYLPSEVQGAEKPGFFSSLFGAKAKDSTPQRYRIKVSSAASQSTVTVLDAQGLPDASQHGSKILQLLADDLK
jgi:outer membrane protein assembly factor BamC